MTDAVAPTFGQIKAQVAAIRKNDNDAKGQVIGIHARGRWEGDEICRDGELVYRIKQCDASIQIRTVLQEKSEDVSATIIITPLTDNQLSEDIRVRLARRKLHPMDPWQIVKLIFEARHIDPRITEHKWMADLLMTLCPAEGYRPVPSGVLDAESIWGILLTRYQRMPSGGPDLIALLKWACDKAAIDRWQAADHSFRDAASQWICQTAGTASLAVLKCVSTQKQPLALPVGLALGVVFDQSVQGKLDKAVGRIEQLTGNTEIDSHTAQRWYTAALGVVRSGFPDAKERKFWLEQSDAFLTSIGAEAFAHISDVSPLGFEQRLTQFGKALSKILSKPSICVTDELVQAKNRIFSHELSLKWGARRTERINMSIRLLHWLERTNQNKIPTYGAFAAAAVDYATDGGFVDWARQTIRAGDATAALSQAYNKLAAMVTQLREAQNRAFATLLRDWTNAGSTGSAVHCIENVIEAVIAPIAAQKPVLILLVDGMSCAVFRELLHDLTQDWAELGPEDGSLLAPVIATIPSLTKLSRTSFFCGSLREGGSQDEIKGFADHPALRKLHGTKTDPSLFHKVTVTDEDDDSLAQGLRKTIASKAHPIVGVVINAVDDHLLKGDQTDPKWRADYIRALPSLLHEAKLADRIVVLISDHGHMIENGTNLQASGEGERWRAASGDPMEGELRIPGSRVVAGGSTEIIAPWTEKLRYGVKKNGYHGGLTPQEMVVPMAILTASDAIPDGWCERASYLPAWWESTKAILEEEKPKEKPLPASKKKKPSKGQMPLFGSESISADKLDGDQPEKDAAATWIEALLASDIYKTQKSHTSRGLPKDEVIHRFVSILEQHGGKITFTALSRELNVPEFRLRGLLASVQRVLNVEGYAILSRDDPSQTVALNKDLLKRQFELSD